MHSPLEETDETDAQRLAKLHALVQTFMQKRPAVMDWQKVDQALQEQKGYPIEIGTGLTAEPVIQTPLNPVALVGKNKSFK